MTSIARPPSKSRRVLVTVITAMAAFIAFVDATIVNIAFPSIHADFSSHSIESLSWIINVYNIAFAALLLPAGRYADRFGRKRVFLVGLTVFVASSLACALAGGLWLLVIARGFQAVGAALIVPASLSLLLPMFPEDRRGVAVSIFAATAALASGIGPALGGLLIQISDWRLVFAVNVPIGLITLAAAWRWLREAKESQSARRTDALGALCAAAGFGMIALAIAKGDDWGWTNITFISCLFAGVLLVSIVARRCVTQENPLVNTDIFTARAVKVASVATFVFAIPFFGFLLANVLFLTSVWEYSALRAGLAMSPPPLIAVLVAGVAGRLYDRGLGRHSTFAGGLLVGAGLLYYAVSVTYEPDFLAAWLPGALLSGFGVGLMWPNLTSASMQDVTDERFATATAFNSALRQLGGVIGVSAVAAYLSSPSAEDPISVFRDVWIGATAISLVAGFIGLGLSYRSVR